MLHKSKAASGSVDMSSKTNVPASNNRMSNWTALLLALQTVQLLHFSTFINFKIIRSFKISSSIFYTQF